MWQYYKFEKYAITESKMGDNLKKRDKRDR